MFHVALHLDGERCWPDLTALRAAGKLIDLMDEDAGLELAALPKGTVGGNTTVTIRLRLPDDRVVLVQTTLKLLKLAVQAFEARHGEERLA